MKSPAGLDSEQYSFLDQETVASLNEVATRIAPLSFQEIVSTFNVPEPSIYSPEGYKPIQVLDYVPQKNGRYVDYDDTVVIHGEFSSGIDENYVMHLIPLIGSLSTKRLVAFGSPARWGIPYNRLTIPQALEVAKKDFSPIVLPRLDYLRNNRIKAVLHAVHDGASFGGDVVTEVPIQAAKHNEFNHQVKAIVSEDGVTDHSRDLLKLGKDFLSVANRSKEYMSQADCPQFREARKIAHTDNPIVFATNLMRVSNWGIISRLAKGGMEQRVDNALSLNPEMVAVLINLGDSELSMSGVMNSIRLNLQNKYPNRVRGETLEGISHAVNDQIFANAGIKLHGIKLATRSA